jgi:hypothetical protein
MRIGTRLVLTCTYVISVCAHVAADVLTYTDMHTCGGTSMGPLVPPCIPPNTTALAGPDPETRQRMQRQGNMKPKAGK